MISPRLGVAGVLLAGIALLSAACGGVKNPEGWASPALDDSAIYFFPKKDRVTAASLGADGSVTAVWTFPDDAKGQKDYDFKAAYDAVTDGEALYFGSFDGRVFALDVKDGGVRWALKDEIDGGLASGPVLAGDRVIFGTTEGRVYAVDKATGRTASGWPSGGIKFNKGVWAPPVVQGDTVFIATMGGELHARNVADGGPSAKWAAPFEVEGAIADLTLLDDAHLFVPGLDKHVYIVETATGKGDAQGFTTRDWVWTRAAFKDGIAYFGDFSGEVYALDITTLQAKWTADVGSEVKAAPVLAGDGVLVVASKDPEVVFFKASDGTVLNRVPLPDVGTVRAGLVLRDGNPLLVTTQGRLFQPNPSNFSVPELIVTGVKR